jgi:hypothetical protein
LENSNLLQRGALTYQFNYDTKKQKETSNTEYFEEPVYTYSLKAKVSMTTFSSQVIHVRSSSEGDYRPSQGKADKETLKRDRIL